VCIRATGVASRYDALIVPLMSGLAGSDDRRTGGASSKSVASDSLSLCSCDLTTQSGRSNFVRMKSRVRHVGIAAGLGLVAVGTVGAMSAHAGYNSVGADGSCGDSGQSNKKEFCLAKESKSNGSLDLYMTGYTVGTWFGSENVNQTYGLGGRSFSNGGGTVASNVNAVRNTWGRRFCLYDGNDLLTSSLYSFNGWKNTSSDAKYINTMIVMKKNAGYCA